MQSEAILIAIIMFIVIVALVSAVFFLIHGRGGQARAEQSAARPKYILTYLLFIHLVALNKKAAESEARSEKGEEFRSHYLKFIPLSEHQAETLSRIAEECITEINREEKKAMRIDQIVSEARELLRARLGEADFVRLDKFIDERFEPAVQNYLMPSRRMKSRGAS